VEYSFDLLQYLSVPESKDSKTGLFQPLGADFVVSPLPCLAMLISIQFEYQTCLQAAEVSDVRADGMLAPELEAELSVAQTTPELECRVSRLSAQSPGTIAKQRVVCHLSRSRRGWFDFTNAWSQRMKVPHPPPK